MQRGVRSDDKKFNVAGFGAAELNYGAILGNSDGLVARIQGTLGVSSKLDFNLLGEWSISSSLALEPNIYTGYAHPISNISGSGNMKIQRGKFGATFGIGNDWLPARINLGYNPEYGGLERTDGGQTMHFNAKFQYDRFAIEGSLYSFTPHRDLVGDATPLYDVGNGFVTTNGFFDVPADLRFYKTYWDFTASYAVSNRHTLSVSVGKHDDVIRRDGQGKIHSWTNNGEFPDWNPNQYMTIHVKAQFKLFRK